MVLLAVFVAATLAWVVLSLALSFRQTRAVAQHRRAVPADFADTVTAEDHAKAADYTIARERLARLDTIAGTALTLAWVFGGIGLLQAGVARVFAPGLTRDVAFLLGTGVVAALVELPFAVYRAFGIEQRFGFNRTTPGTFVLDRLKRAVLSLALAIPLLAAVLWTMRHASGLWWLYAWAGLVTLMLVAPGIFVRFVAPRFNKFEPLPEGELRRRIETRLAASGFKADGLFTMDASRRTAHGNAYFIGFGRTKRIVLFDTLIARSTPAEIEAVVAHELGHFLHRHVLFGVLRSAAMLFAVLALSGWLSKQPWLLPAFGLHDGGDGVALFLCALLASVLGPLAAPIGNWISRRNEYQADDYARRTVGVQPMVGALTRLARDNASTLTPDPWYALVHYSHPTVPLRIRHMRAAEAGATAS